MYILLSPAKSLDFTRDFPAAPHGAVVPRFNTQTKALHNVLKALSAKEIADLMHISPKLAQLNYERFQDWSGNYNKQALTPADDKNFDIALSAFIGDVYKSFDLESYTTKDWQYADEHIGILSGFYGLLSPLTYMRPYRLEMGTRLSFNVKGKEYKNLYEYWSDDIVTYINQILTEKKITDRIVLNLASIEYAKAADLKSIDGKVITVDFKVDKGDGNLKTIGIHAKKSRGALANLIVQKRIETIEELCKTKPLGFTYKKSLSTESVLVFVKKIF